jgi:hypothetical protein
VTEELGITGNSGPDNQDHAWNNYCLYCKTPNYQPGALADLELWHYCINCVLRCMQCGFPKPLFAFPYDYASPVYTEWRRRFNAREIGGYAPKQAHEPICCRCSGRNYTRQERILKEEATRKHKELVQSPEAQAALSAILDSLS